MEAHCETIREHLLIDTGQWAEPATELTNQSRAVGYIDSCWGVLNKTISKKKKIEAHLKNPRLN